MMSQQQNQVNNLLPTITQSQCVGNTVNALKTSSQSDYFIHINDECVQQELIKRDIINDINVVIRCENDNNNEFVEFDDMQLRILLTFIRKWTIIIKLMNMYQEIFAIIFEKEFIKYRIRLQRQQRAVRINKPSKSALARTARHFGIENIKIYLQDDKFNWDKYRKYKIISEKGEFLQAIHNHFNISSIAIADPQTKEPITFTLEKKKELYSETGLMVIANWCDKVLSLPRIQSINAATDVAKLAYIWDDGWTHELMESILANVNISNYPLFIPTYRILNKDKLRNILKNNNLEHVMPRPQRSNKQQEFEEHLLSLQQQITDYKNAQESVERECNVLRQEYDEYKVGVMGTQHRLNMQIQSLQQQVHEYENNYYQQPINTDELLNRLDAKDNEINALKLQNEEYKLILDSHEEIASNITYQQQQQKIRTLQYQINRITDLNRSEIIDKDKEIAMLRKRLECGMGSWDVYDSDNISYDSDIYQTISKRKRKRKRFNHTRDLSVSDTD